mmetsp:Transcript_2173/g.5126  ORF Transcript_2173/g.5126 Transcript_2173/m.5126 type:complete len:111 (-) Transcript_2173:80-412(-)
MEVMVHAGQLGAARVMLPGWDIRSVRGSGVVVSGAKLRRHSAGGHLQRGFRRGSEAAVASMVVLRKWLKSFGTCRGQAVKRNGKAAYEVQQLRSRCRQQVQVEGKKEEEL